MRSITMMFMVVTAVAGCAQNQSVGRSTIAAPKATALAEYEISVQNRANSIELSCKKGCAWTKLSFEAKPDAAPVAVDFFGMANAAEPNAGSPFALTVQHTRSAVNLTSSKGSAWNHLGIGCQVDGCAPSVNQMGMMQE